MKKISIVILLTFSSIYSFSQGKFKFESTASVGSFNYFVGLVMVDPGPGWHGYNLPRGPGTGFLISTTNGVSISEWFHAGIGIGHGNFKHISGIMLFADLHADFSKRPFAMFAYVNPGYSHFWNQYDGGTGTAMFDFGLGARRQVFDKSKALLSVGLLSMQQNTYVSVKLGYTF